MTRRLVCALLGAALALTACSSDSSDPSSGETPDPAAVGGDVDRVPGQVVDADSIAVSPDGARIAAGCLDQLCIWDTADGSLAATYYGGNVVAWSPDGTLLATSSFSEGRAAVVLAAPEDGSEAGRVPAHDVPGGEDAVGVGITDLVFSPDGTLLASAGHDGTVRIWSVPDLTPVAEIQTLSADPDALAFSPDGRRLAVASPDEPVEEFEVPSGEFVGTLGDRPQNDIAWGDGGFAVDGDAAAAYRLAFSPDGVLAFTLAEDDTVYAGSEELVGHEEQPRDLAWSPDGGTLYSASAGEGILAWDPETGELLREFEVPTG